MIGLNIHNIMQKLSCDTYPSHFVITTRWLTATRTTTCTYVRMNATWCLQFTSTYHNYCVVTISDCCTATHNCCSVIKIILQHKCHHHCIWYKLYIHMYVYPRVQEFIGRRVSNSIQTHCAKFSLVHTCLKLTLPLTNLIQ